MYLDKNSVCPMIKAKKMPVMPNSLKLTQALFCAAAVSLALLALATPAQAQDATPSQVADAPLETVHVTGNWLGTGLQNSVKNFAGARTVVRKEDMEDLLFVDRDLAYDLLWSFVRTLSSRLRETNDKMTFMAVTSKF